MLVNMKFYHHLLSSQPRSTPPVKTGISLLKTKLLNKLSVNLTVYLSVAFWPPLNYSNLIENIVLL